jgi:hypothetical protein
MPIKPKRVGYICSKENKSEHKLKLHVERKCDIKSLVYAMQQDAAM